MFNRIRTGGDCDAADYCVLALGIIFITPFAVLLITLPEVLVSAVYSWRSPFPKIYGRKKP